MEKEKKPQWPSGVLTHGVIEKDVKNSTLVQAVALSVGAVLLAVVAWPSLMASSDMDLRTIAFLAGIVILGALAAKAWMKATAKLDYRIEEDKILSKEMKEIYEDRDAELTGMSTRVPVLQLEKHGTYTINADQIHDYYIPLQIIHDFQEQEEVYMVYDKKSGKLLRIYRKKIKPLYT